VLARTECVRSLGGFDPRLDGVEDWDLWLRLASATPCVRLPEALVLYRDRSSGYSKNLRRVYRAMRRLMNKATRQYALATAEHARLTAWHELRFMVAFQLVGDRRASRLARRRALLQPLPAVMWGGLRLVPFLWGRVVRRGLRRVRG
jgi:GT2 family glycosyltransferase